jgi:hypothetical protein
MDLKTSSQISALQELKKLFDDKIIHNESEINRIDIEIWKFEIKIEALKEIQTIANDYESVGGDFRNKQQRVYELKKKQDLLKNNHFLEEKKIINAMLFGLNIEDYQQNEPIDRGGIIESHTDHSVTIDGAKFLKAVCAFKVH